MISSKPQLILLPGLDGTTRLLAPFCAAVSDGFSAVHAIAYPTDRPLDYLALEAYARERLPRHEPFVLLGESFSGPIAISIAAERPSNMIGLILSTTFACAPIPLSSTFSSFTRFAPVRALPTSALSIFLLGRWATPALRRELRTALDTVAPDVLRARAAAAMRVDVSSKLASIRVPTLYLRARHDRLLYPAARRRISNGIAQAQEIALDGPHLLLQTRTECCARAVVNFADAIDHDALDRR
jgi:pimeloyl-[acyl-carrier protein] methyl ester esterase